MGLARLAWVPERRCGMVAHPWIAHWWGEGGWLAATQAGRPPSGACRLATPKRDSGCAPARRMREQGWEGANSEGDGSRGVPALIPSRQTRSFRLPVIVSMILYPIQRGNIRISSCG